MKRKPEELRVTAWNPHRGNNAARVSDTLTDEARKFLPALIVLNEVRLHRDTLARWAKAYGYLHFQEVPRATPPGQPVDERGSTAMLVRDGDGWEVEKHRVVSMRVPWKVFSHNQPHRPRRYEQLRLRSPGGRRVKGRASHWPTNGFDGGNRAAFAESARRAAVWLAARRPRDVALDVGDHNESVPRLRKWARPFRGSVVGHGPDSLIVTGASRVDSQTMGKNGSDHHLVRYRVTLR